MEILVNAVLFNGPDEIEKFLIKVTESNYAIILEKLSQERKKIIDYLQMLKEEKIIKSVYIPKNRQYQRVLDELIKLKKIIKDSINKIRVVYK